MTRLNKQTSERTVEGSRPGQSAPGLKGKGAAGAWLLSLLAAISVGCGGSSPSSPTPVAAPSPAPAAAAITAVGDGALVLHPSANPAFAIAMETPIRITETGGGTADWNFARISFFLNGREVERGEVGADGIQNSGSNRITANTSSTRTVLFRFNSDDFDRIDITLGFGDANTGRQFTVAVPGSTFTDVNISLTPLLRSSDPR